jgi:hypothetical protein
LKNALAAKGGGVHGPFHSAVLIYDVQHLKTNREKFCFTLLLIALFLV